MFAKKLKKPDFAVRRRMGDRKRIYCAVRLAPELIHHIDSEIIRRANIGMHVTRAFIIEAALAKVFDYPFDEGMTRRPSKRKTHRVVLENEAKLAQILRDIDNPPEAAQNQACSECRADSKCILHEEV